MVVGTWPAMSAPLPNAEEENDETSGFAVDMASHVWMTIPSSGFAHSTATEDIQPCKISRSNTYFFQINVYFFL